MRNGIGAGGVNVRGIGLCVLAVLVVLVPGCSSDPEECERVDDGLLVPTVIPDLEGSGDLVSVEFNATLESIEDIFTTPPVTRYRFRRTDNSQVVSIDFNDLGYTVPLDVGTDYDVRVEKGTVLEFILFSWAVVFTDDKGVAAMVVSDWQPGFSVLTTGGSDPQWRPPDGFSLAVGVEETGCKPRIENSRQFRDVTNRKLSFVLSGDQLALYHGSGGTLGDYEVRVFRAQRAVHKDTPVNAILQYGFALARMTP